LAQHRFYRDFGYGLVYPQIFPHHHRRSEEGHAATVDWGKEKSKFWLHVLDERLLGAGRPTCAATTSPSRLPGPGMVSLMEAIGCNLGAIPTLRAGTAR